MSEQGIARNAPIAIEPAIAEEKVVQAEEAKPHNVERVQEENPREKVNQLLLGFDIKRLVL